MHSCYVTSYKTWKNFSPLQLEDLCKQATVSLGYPNLKEEQKRVVTSCLAEKTATAHAENIHAHHVLQFHHYVIMQALTIPRATDTSRVYILSRPDPSSPCEGSAAPDYMICLSRSFAVNLLKN